METDSESVAGDDNHRISSSSDVLVSKRADSESLGSLEPVVRSRTISTGNAESAEHANFLASALSTALPPSSHTSESTANNLYRKAQDLGRSQRQSSLDALEYNASTTERRFQPGEFDRAASTALPESIKSTSSSRNCTDGDDGTFPANDSTPRDQTLRSHCMPHPYHYMPHLKNVWEYPRSHDRADLGCFDYHSNGSVSMQRHAFNGDLGSCQDEFHKEIIDDIPSDLKCRLLVVEDLSWKMIRILSKCPNISPEFFEEHLINSGWQDEEYNDAESDTWSTRDLVKDYISIRWYRPTKGRVTRPKWHSSSQGSSKFESTKKPQKWDEEISKGPTAARRATVRSNRERGSRSITVRHSAQPTFNILRKDWEPDLDTESFSAWEESATVWKTQLLACQLVVILLDPLPIVRHHAEVPSALMEARETARSSLFQHSSTNRDIRQWVNDTSENEREASEPIAPSVKSDIPSPSRGQVHVEAGLSDNTEHSTDQDPENGERHRNGRRKSILSRITSTRTFRASSNVPRNTSADMSIYDNIPDDGRMDTRDLDSDHCIFEGLPIRLPLMAYNDIFLPNPEKRCRLALQMASTDSTAFTIREALCSDRVDDIQVRRFAPLEHLFMIILIDTTNVLRSMNTALTGIGVRMLDDFVLQSRVDLWRQIFNRFEAELLHMELSLRDFVAFKEASEVGDAAAGMETGSTKVTFAKCLTQISDVRQRTKSSYKSLMTLMSLVESKRGISEAESVTKLTELAFFFIPLTFAASLFSMQIKELSTSTASLGDFFLVAILLTASSYSLRLIIRSPVILRYWRNCKEDIRETSQIPADGPITTSSFLSWLWARTDIMVCLVYISIPLCAAILLATIWTRPLRRGMKVVRGFWNFKLYSDPGVLYEKGLQNHCIDFLTWRKYLANGALHYTEAI